MKKKKKSLIFALDFAKGKFQQNATIATLLPRHKAWAIFCVYWFEFFT